ncbi:MAG: hypothetical protein AAFQ99_13130, partial [Pseudomonadota bacterium]
MHLLDRLPLAVELAASRSRMFTPRKMLNRMTRRFDMLKSRSRDLPERQRTLYATLQWSWELLTPQEQAALSQCSVFRGGFTLDAAEAVLALDDTEWVDDVLGQLIDKSMIRSHEQGDTREIRLSLLMSVQQFASQQLANAEAVERRHGQALVQFAEDAASPKQLQTEFDNLLIACQRAAQRDDVDTLSRLIKPVGNVFFSAGPFREGGRFLDTLWEQLPSRLANSLDLNILIAAGRLWLQAGEFETCQARLNDVQRYAREHGFSDATLRATALQAEWHYRSGSYDDAIRLSQDTIQLAQEQNNHTYQWKTHSNLGMMFTHQGRLEESEHHLR